MNNHTIGYIPWDNSTLGGVLAILFAAWIGTANLSLILLFITNPKLLNSRQNIVLLHNTIVDLTAGVFYCPLQAEYSLRGYWTHGCNSFFVWFTFNYPLSFLTVHSALMILILRALPLFCKKVGIRLNRIVANVLFCVAFLLLWGYLIILCVFLDRFRGSDVFPQVTIAPGVQCKGFVAMDKQNVIDALVYFIPASLSVILLISIVVREKTTLEIPRTQLQLDSITEQTPSLSLRSLSSVILLTCVFPLPSFIMNAIIAISDVCDTTVCFQRIFVLSAISDWIMVSKCGLLPILLLVCLGRHAQFWSSSSPSSSNSSSTSFRGVLHSFKRVSGGRRDRLVAEDDFNEEDNDNRFDDDDDDDEDAPFSNM